MKTKVLMSALVLGLVIGFNGNLIAEPVEAGFGKIKLNGLLQFWYQNDTGAKPADTFRLRRSEIKLSGDIKPEVSWAIMFDPAQVREDDVKTTAGNVTSVGRKSVLQDFVISLKHEKCCSIDLGQYKVPFGMEGLESSSKLDFVERSALASQFKWADYRDVGFTVKGDFKAAGVVIQPSAGLFNGEGQNKIDANEPIDFAGRLVIKPLDSLHVGFAHYEGKTGAAESGNVHTGGEIKWIKDPVSVYGEYAAGKSGGKNKNTYYAAATYKFLNVLQGAVKYDFYDPDADTNDDANTEATLGVNYFMEKHNSKIQLNYVLRGEEGDSVNNDMVRINVQTAF